MRPPHGLAAKFRKVRAAFGYRKIQFVDALCPVPFLPRNWFALELAGCAFAI